MIRIQSCTKTFTVTLPVEPRHGRCFEKRGEMNVNCYDEQKLLLQPGYRPGEIFLLSRCASKYDFCQPFAVFAPLPQVKTNRSFTNFYVITFLKSKVCVPHISFICDQMLHYMSPAQYLE